MLAVFVSVVALAIALSLEDEGGGRRSWQASVRMVLLLNTCSAALYSALTADDENGFLVPEWFVVGRCIDNVFFWLMQQRITILD